MLESCCLSSGANTVTVNRGHLSGAQSFQVVTLVLLLYQQRATILIRRWLFIRARCAFVKNTFWLVMLDERSQTSQKHKKCHVLTCNLYSHFAFFSHVYALLLFFITCLFNTSVLFLIWEEVAHIYWITIQRRALGVSFTPACGI